MDISIADTKVLKFPVEAKLPNQIVFLLDITCGCWRGRVARTYAEIEEFHVFLSSKIKKNEIPAFPAFDTPDVLKTSLVEYFNGISTLAAIGDAEVYVQDILIGYSTYSSQFFKTEEPIIKEGYLALKVDKNYRNFWFVLQGNVLSYFNQRTEAGETVKLPVGSIELQGAKLGKKDDKMFQIATDVGPNEIRAVSSDVRQDWLNTLKDVISASSADISISKELTPQQLKSVSLLRESLGAEYDDLSDAHLVRFLREKLWNVDLSASLIRADRVWRQDVGVERLNILGVYDAIKTGKLYFPGTFDKKGRAIVVFKAKAHDINSDFLETMKLIIYICERAIEAMTDADEVLLIEDLSGFERDQFDARMIKLSLEMVMAHYPSRIGLFVACSSPWYYRLIFKVIRPWLTPDLNSKVHIYGGTEELLNFANKDQLPVELGGTKKFNLNEWIQERARIEGVNLADAGTPKAEHQFGNEEIVASYGDAPASKTVVGCKYEGYLKKQGGFVKKFNKRYCILKGSILYYYKEKTDNKVEGVVPLRGATFRREGATIFHIITHGGKDCIFEIIVDKKSKDEWIPILETEITNLGGNAGRSQPVLSEEVDPIDSFGTEWVAKKLSGGSVQEYNAVASNLDGILWRMINDKNFTPAGKYFRGREIVQWLVSNENISEDNAIQLGKQLVSYQYIYSSNGVEFGNEGLFLPLIYSDSPAINLNKIWVTPARPALQVLESLYNQTILLIQKFSGCIILELLSSSKDLFDLKLALGELQAVDIDSLSASDRISFFINVHNLFILVGQLCLGPAVDLQDRIQLLNLQKLCIGGVQYSASDIMNGILRCNAPAVSSISKKPHFMSKTDPRLKYSLKKSEPLFLFALHPGVTFPFNEVAIKADLESSIKSIAEDYIRKNIQVNDLEIVVSSLLFWHLVDFAKTEKDAFIFLSKFLEPQNQKKLKDLASSGKYIVTARPYPWQSFGIASQFAQ